MFFMDSQTTEPIWTKLGMSPTYDIRTFLGHIPMTLAHSNQAVERPIWTKIGISPTYDTRMVSGHKQQSAFVTTVESA